MADNSGRRSNVDNSRHDRPRLTNSTGRQCTDPLGKGTGLTDEVLTMCNDNELLLVDVGEVNTPSKNDLSLCNTECDISRESRPRVYSSGGQSSPIFAFVDTRCDHRPLPNSSGRRSPQPSAEETQPNSDDALMESPSQTTRDVRPLLQRPKSSGPFCNSRPGKDGGICHLTEFNKWKAALFAEVVSVQHYYHGLDSTDLLDCRVGGLSVAQKRAIDSEYNNWISNEINIGSRRKGPDRRVRRREAGRRKAEAENRAATGKRARRRTEYARVQKLYIKNRADCARKVLAGQWTEQPAQHSLSDQVLFWEGVFGKDSRVDDRQVEPSCDVLWDLIAPVSLTELQATLRNTKKGALGTDNISLADLRRLDPRALLAHLNMWLYIGYLPAGLRTSRTVLIPKVPAPTSPKEYRPISIGPLFHRLLATRLSSRIHYSSRQRAFTKGDGIADNVFLLRCLLKDSCEELKPLSLVFLDVSKAFDSVSHDSLFLAAKRMGVPGPFIEYLRCLYSEASTRLQIGEELSEPLAQNRGVKQGDPLSPILFNCVIDWAIEALDQELGVQVGDDGPRLNHLAFADDIVLMARSKIGIQHLSRQLERALGLCGLTLNPDKSRSLTIAVDGKAGRWVCDPTPYVSLTEGVLPAVPISEGYKYLGVTVSAREGGSSAEELLSRGLNHLTKAPLKPQQRLYITKNHLIPKLYHKLVLSRCNNGVLRRLDKLVRRSLRSWLKLPHDAVNALFHSEMREGGLGIPSFRLAIPLLKKARLDRLARVLDPVISALVANSRTFANERRRCTNPPPKVGIQLSIT